MKLLQVAKEFRTTINRVCLEEFYQHSNGAKTNHNLEEFIAHFKRVGPVSIDRNRNHFTDLIIPTPNYTIH